LIIAPKNLGAMVDFLFFVIGYWLLVIGYWLLAEIKSH